MPTFTTSQYQSALDDCAAQVGIASGEHYTLDGQWHKAQPADKRDRGKLFYCGEWRQTRTGRYYPTCTFYSFRGGGRSIYFNGYTANQSFSDQAIRPATHRPQKPPPDPTKTLRRFRQSIAPALPLDNPQAGTARTYLSTRGLSDILADLPAGLRYHPSLDYWHPTNSGPVRLGTYPALLAVVTSPKNRWVGLHRTYLRPDGSGKLSLPDPDDPLDTLPAKKLLSLTPGATSGGAVRLYPPSSTLAVTEGIETALAVRIATHLPVWAALSASALAALILPPGVRELIIYADLDKSATGQQAAQTLAQRYCLSHRVRIATPSGLLPTDARGIDFLDVLQEGSHGC